MADLTPQVSDRGFKHYEAIPADAAEVRVYESSDASSPHLWLSVTGEAFLRALPRPVVATPYGVADASVSAHLTLEQAAAVGDIIDAAIDGHYQREPGAEPSTRQTLRYVMASHVADIYDDPDGATAESLAALSAAAASVGLDIWDTAQIEAVCGYHVSSHEVGRLNAIRSAA